MPTWAHTFLLQIAIVFLGFPALGALGPCPLTERLEALGFRIEEVLGVDGILEGLWKIVEQSVEADCTAVICK